jgi:triacylglycerol esterase/lipase EstA (alpha/beta hydrolase family)
MLIAAGLVALAIALAGAIGSARRTESTVEEGRPGPVLLVPGYGGGTRSLDRLAAALRASGRDAVVVPPLGDGTGDLREQAGRVDAVARQRLAAGAPSVDVIGYSAGGVTVRLWAEELDGRRVARRVVTLGSPHHGAEVAGLGALLGGGTCPTACRQLAPDSELLAGLRDAPPGPAWVSIWTEDDEIVTPPDSARLQGAVNISLQTVCPDARVSHGQLPTDALVVGIVSSALAATPLTSVPSRSECAVLRSAGGAG